jgi:hypothetical protein
MIFVPCGSYGHFRRRLGRPLDPYTRRYGLGRMVPSPQRRADASMVPRGTESLCFASVPVRERSCLQPASLSAACATSMELALSWQMKAAAHEVPCRGPLRRDPPCRRRKVNGDRRSRWLSTELALVTLDEPEQARRPTQAVGSTAPHVTCRMQEVTNSSRATCRV